MSITFKPFGRTVEGEEILIYTLANTKGMKAEIISYGGIIKSLYTPDRNGNLTDITLGFDTLESYMVNPPYFGALIGRYGNRIKDAQFVLNGKKYILNKNEKNNHLHGGPKGYHKVVWKSEIIKQGSEEALQLKYRSVDGEEGYPGNLEITVIYCVSEQNELKINYFAVSDMDTPVNLTNHAYFNLNGHSSGSVSKHKIMINADKFTAVDAESIPTGELRDVSGTPMDLRSLTTIEPGLSSTYEQITFGCGYDHNWVLNKAGDLTSKSAEVYDEASGRVLELYTNKPGVQFYTGNFLDSSVIGKGNVHYDKNHGLCLETQFFPDSIRNEHFPSPILRAGQKYEYATIYKFSTK